MQKVAEWLGVPSAALLLELLVGTASSAHPETRIVVKESIGFVEPLIIYGGLVTESGQRKSPTINAVLMPSNNFKPRRKNALGWILLNTSANRKSGRTTVRAKRVPNFAHGKMNSQLHPPLRELYLDIATVEAIDKLKGQQPDTAFVLLKDELSGLFGSYGAYKKR
jgi:hypothetical protein